MLICHQLGEGGWTGADKYVRFGLDYLWHCEHEEDRQENREFSIVEIGKGRVGRRDGAEPVFIHQAMATSHLPLTLFVNHNDSESVRASEALVIPLKAYRAWTPEYGEQRFAA